EEMSRAEVTMAHYNYSISAANGTNGQSVSLAGVASASDSAVPPEYDTYVTGVLAPPDCALATITYENFGSVFVRPRDRLSWLHEFFSDRVLRIIRRVTAGKIARADVDVDDVYQQALLDCLRSIEAKPLAAKDYLPLLLRIAQRR